MTNDDTQSRDKAEARARLLWNDLPGTGTGGDTFRDHLWDGLTDDERDALVDYTTAVWQAAQLDLAQKAVPMRVQGTAHTPQGSALVLESEDREAVPVLEPGKLLAVLL